MGQPVTTNPFIIMLINMTIVFGVLFGLQLLIQLIHIVDPTKKEKAEPKAAPAPKAAVPVSVAPVQDNTAIVAVIAGAVAAYGYSSTQIVAVRPLENTSWKGAGRLSGINNTVV